MKRIIILLFALGLFGCSDFLKESSQDEIRPSTVDDMDQLLNGEAYTELYTDYLLGITDIFTDDIQCRGASIYYPDDKTKLERERWKFGWQKDMFDEGGGGNIVSYWELPYRKIKGCNVVLDYLDKVRGDDTRRENLRGEALTLRGFYYLMLVNFFGQPYNAGDPEKNLGVPLKLHMDVTEELFPRESVATVYRQIEQDLLEGNRLLEENDFAKSLHRMNHIAAKAILSRMYLYMEDWDNALKYADEVLKVKPNLLTLAMFRNPDDNTSSEGVYNKNTLDEVIWYRAENGYANMRALAASPYSASDDLLRLYEVSPAGKVLDLRYNTYFTNYTDYNSFDFISMSFKRVPDIVCKDRNDGCLGIRTAEMYLNRAEAYIHKYIVSDNEEFREKALSDLNFLREHRYDTRTTTYIPVDKDGEALLNFYKEERRRELCGEGNHRWFDLRRYGMPELEHIYFLNLGEEQKFTLQANSPRYVLPIPQQVLEYNRELEQNP
ncbi:MULTISPECIES: RagB/SusD family nutrient uptake outer membrane protein [Butyricimonas]|uniref:RagB/SusD family nutrient uptake outer membrane protein n=1 Tax=Butyricimonas TaxID=574697 RepID=UPI0003A1C4C0|nr:MULTISPECIES: RagB/SusD family nutrient uptake outer membrane protein [Butyricimonas]